MQIDRSAIFSQLVYDVDNRYVDLVICRNASMPETFTLSMSDTANNSELDTQIDIFLTENDLSKIIKRLTKALEKPIGIE